jgi:tetratricopeptide (TPR) repeat protein
LNFLILLLSFTTSKNEQLKKTRDFYQLPLLVEPNFVEKGEAYLNLSVIDMRLNDLEKALSEAKKAAYYGRKSEATYLEGVIHYIRGDMKKAALKFKEINKWQYTCFLENLYSFIPENQKSSKNCIPFSDSLSFYFIFQEKDTFKILERLENSSLPLWQNFLGRGYLCYERGKYRRALNYFNESYKITPTEYTGIYIISTLFQLSELDSLISFQERNSIMNPLTNYLKGEAYYKKGETEKAMQIFLSDTSSQYKAHAIFGAGWSKYRLAKYSESAELFEKFLEVYEDKELKQYALYRLARALLKQGKIESLEYFKTLVKEYPDSPLKDDAYLLLGKINFLLNNYDESIKWLNLLIEEDSSSYWIPSAYKFLGEIYTDRKDFKTALAYYRKILSFKQVPVDLLDEARYKIEEIKLKRGEYSTNIYMYKMFTNKYPKSQRTPSLLLKIGQYYQAANRYDLAIQYNNKVLLNYPESEEANESLLNLVKIYQAMGDRTSVIALLKKGLREKPELSNELNLKLGEVYYESGDPKKAIEYYKEVNSNVLKPYTLYQISLIYQELGLLNETRIPLENIIENFPKSDYIDEAYLLLAKTYMQDGSLKKSIEILDKGLKNLGNKDIWTLLSFKADIYCEINDEEALDLYLESANFASDNKNKIETLEKGRECAIRLNKYKKAELFGDLINKLKSPEK